MQVSRTAIDEMLAHARESLPDECCGLLIGRRHRIDRVYRSKNLQASPTRYLIDPIDHFAAIRDAREKGNIVMGAYHSHPSGGTSPSKSDIDQAAGGRDFLYVIVAPDETNPDDQVGAFRVRNGVAERVRLVPG